LSCVCAYVCPFPVTIRDVIAAEGGSCGCVMTRRVRQGMLTAFLAMLFALALAPCVVEQVLHDLPPGPEAFAS